MSFCGPAQLNSTGMAARLRGFGSTAVADDHLELTAWQLPPHEAGLFLVSQTQAFVQPPGSSGNLCLGGSIGRYTAAVGDTGAAGELVLDVDLGHLPTHPPAAVQPGETWNWQAWFRDTAAGPTSNFTDGLSVTFD